MSAQKLFNEERVTIVFDLVINGGDSGLELLDLLLEFFFGHLDALALQLLHDRLVDHREQLLDQATILRLRGLRQHQHRIARLALVQLRAELRLGVQVVGQVAYNTRVVHFNQLMDGFL